MHRSTARGDAVHSCTRSGTLKAYRLARLEGARLAGLEGAAGGRWLSVTAERDQRGVVARE